MKGLYLRTLFALDLKAGGSVGHTAGVINSMRKYIHLDVISNDKLVGVTGEVTIIAPKEHLFINCLPTFFKEIYYNFNLLSYLNCCKEYDFIYQRHTGISFAGAYLSKKNQIPFILEFNSSEVWKLDNWRDGNSKKNALNMLKNLFRQFIKTPMINRMERYNLKNASLIIVVSKALKKTLMMQGIDEKKILINPNGVDVGKYNPHVDSKHVIKKYDLKGYKVVGFIGTFGQWHGIIEMVKAIYLFHEKYKEVSSKTKFLLIGDGILFEQAKALVQSTGLLNKVIFTGLVPQENAPEYLSACDIFLSPHINNPDNTEFFGSPTKLFEYMAMGKGIIASKVGQIGDILSHGEDAVLVEPGNIEELAQSIECLLTNDQLRQTISINVRNKVTRQYTWDSHVEKILLYFKRGFVDELSK